MRHLPIAIAFTTIIATAANAQNVSAGAGSKESREAIGNTGTTPPAPPPDATQPGANDAAPVNAAEPRFKVSGGFMQQFNTGLNTGGNYAASRAYGAFSSRTLCRHLRQVRIGHDHLKVQGAARAHALGQPPQHQLVCRHAKRSDKHARVGDLIQQCAEVQVDVQHGYLDGGERQRCQHVCGGSEARQ